MKSYFKYTSGESYQLNGTDYVGFFHIDENGKIFTEKSKTPNSLELSKKNTFLSDIYTEKIELNTTYKNIDSPISYFVNTFDILNKERVDRIANTINYNNLITIKGSILDNPNIYNFNPLNNHYYSLSGPNETTLIGKNDYYFSYPFPNTKWEFLDNIKTGIIIVDDDENFKYLCSTGDTQYLLQGSFINKSPIKIIWERDALDDTLKPEYTYQIYHDEEEDKIISVNDTYINIYDSSNFALCDSLILIDRIKLESSENIEEFIWDIVNYKWEDFEQFPTDRYGVSNINNPNSIKFGKNIRTELLDNLLYIKNKYLSDTFNIIDLKKYNIENVLDIDVRDIDDLIIILHKNENTLNLSILDLDDIENVQTFVLYSINQNMEWFKIKFSIMDSDIFHIYNEKEYQTRHLSNPTYPSGRMENNNFYYLEKYSWNNASIRYVNSKFFWNYYQRTSNYYNNILGLETFKNGKMYFLLHNFGRLITMYQNPINRYESNVSTNLEKKFTNIKCSETSIGLLLNLNMRFLIEDILSIYRDSLGKFDIQEQKINKIYHNDVGINSQNFYLHGNETLNVLSLQRILLNIYNLQKNIISSP